MTSLEESSPHGRGFTASDRAQDELGIALADPAYTETTWEPNPYQARVLACDGGLVAAIGGIGAGKSEAAALLLLRWALRHPRRSDGNPTRWFVVGPEFSLIRSEQFAKILGHARRLKGLGYGSLVRRVVYGQDPKIVLRDGQILIGRSGDQYRRMEGHEVDGVWQDEAHRQPEKAFSIALSRQRSTDAIRFVISANPEEPPDWIWRMINGHDERYNKLREKLLTRGGLRVFRWTSQENTANKGDVLEVIAAALEATSSGHAGQKLSGLFPGTHELPAVGTVAYGRAFVGVIHLTGEEARPNVLGVDVGETDDFSWLTVLSARGVVLYMERFNAGSPGVPRAGFYPWLEDRIQAVVQTWRVGTVVIDVAKAGKPIQQSLERKSSEGKFSSGRPKVLGFDCSVRRKKSDAILTVQLAMSRADIRVPTGWSFEGRKGAVDFVPNLQKEFEELVPREVGEGQVVFDHPVGGHDDGVTSLAMAWWARGSSRTSPSDYSGWQTPKIGGSPRFIGGRGGRFAR